MRASTTARLRSSLRGRACPCVPERACARHRRACARHIGRAGACRRARPRARLRSDGEAAAAAERARKGMCRQVWLLAAGLHELGENLAALRCWARRARASLPVALRGHTGKPNPAHATASIPTTRPETLEAQEKTTEQRAAHRAAVPTKKTTRGAAAEAHADAPRRCHGKQTTRRRGGATTCTLAAALLRRGLC